MIFVLIVLVLQGLIFGFFCGYIASEKGRNYGSWFALGFFFSILAVFALIAVPKIESASRDVGEGSAWPPAAPDRPTSIPTSAPQHLFDGQRDIAFPAYQLFLTKRFGVEKNSTLDKFVIGDEVFDDLPDALANADARYGQQLAEQAAQKLQLERVASAREQSRIEAAQRDRARGDESRARWRESIALRRQKEEAHRKAIRKAKPWAIGAVVVICVVGGLLFRQHSIQEEEARIARQAAEEATRIARQTAEEATRIAWQTAYEAMRPAWQSPGKVIKDCAVCPTMIVIPAGSFEMGSGADGLPKEQPRHQVKLPGFLLSRTEVTQGQWRAVMGGPPFVFSGCGGSDDCPVTSISWTEAQLFATKLSQKTGKNYRLPSEAEWEYAARAGSRGQWSFGDNEPQLKGYAWFRANSNAGRHPVGQKKANAIGLHDMHGNVGEWVQDSSQFDYQGAPGDGSAWSIVGERTRVVRGGDIFGTANDLRSADRSSKAYYDDSPFIGVRIARTL